MNIRWKASASADLDNIRAYIALSNNTAAARMVRDIVVTVGRLKDFPGSGRPGRVPGTRELVTPGKPYIVLYRVKDKAVEVLRVFHTSRKIEHGATN